MITKRGSRYIGLGMVLAAAITLVSHVSVLAQTTLKVHIGPTIVDVCPNILGIQPSIPTGMIIDSNNNCVTPPPPTVDICRNIDGVQTTIPVGYFRDANGDCLPQPPSPIDVCPNIIGMQSAVPTALIVDAFGNCIAPPVDECPNIDGPQASIPLGMVKVDTMCFTPAPLSDTNPSSGGSSTTYGGTVPQSSSPNYKNVPDVLDPVIEPLVNLVPEPVKQIVKAVPKQIAQTVPYYIYAVLGISTVALAFQTLREISSTHILIALLKRERSIAEQKDNFMALASHYLRTPLTLMSNGLDTVIALKESTAPRLKPLRMAVSSMDQNVASILHDIESNQALKDITAPSATLSEPHIFRSLFFWGPVVGSALLALLSNFLLGVVADVDLGMANVLFQGVVIASISMAFYAAVRNYFIHKKQRQKQQELISHEHIVDEARNAFIRRTTAVLSNGLSDIYKSRPALGTIASARSFDDGYMRFNAMLEKFLLLSQLRSDHTYETSSLNLHNVVSDIIDSYKDQLKNRSITIKNGIDPSITTTQNRTLFEFIIRSIVDNAIKFNKENGTIRIDANKDTKHFSVSVTDSGVGIPRDKLSQVFQPFSHANSALQFDYEGLGFSLFLDKIITDYIGGSIVAASNQSHGTNITVRAT